MKKIFLLLVLSAAFLTKAQVGIGTNAPTSTLDVNGSVSNKVTTVTASIALGINDAVVLCNNTVGITISLPSAGAITGRIYTIKSINTATVLVATVSGETIDGAASASLSSQYDELQLISDGGNWYLLNKKSATQSGSQHSIGESYGGGIIFYLDASGNHGLVAAPSDQSTGVKWNNPGAEAGEYFYAQLQGLFSGRANTSFINFFNPGVYAASICDGLVLNTYSDWYLPSVDELNLMYRNLYLEGLGNFSGSSYYWSSTAYQNTNEGAYGKFFGSGEQSVSDISDPNNVRAVRAF
ncbi:MAG: hypothetical protein ABI707_08045 [Ferruginibacter sp.]